MKILRILNLDGGGMKGLFSSYFMKKFCTQAGIQGDEIWKHFDFIGGTSIGAIMGGSYACGQSPDVLINFFKTIGPKIFTGLAGGTGPLSAAVKLADLVGPLSSDLRIDSFYGTGGITHGGTKPNKVLYDELKNILGDIKMFQLKTNALFTVVHRTSVDTTDISKGFNYRPVLLSNLLAPGLEGQNLNVREVIQASGSAPLYLPPYPLPFPKSKDPSQSDYDAYSTNGWESFTNLYLDGGIGINNPSVFLLTYSNTLGVDYDKIVMLSVGCGLGNVGFFEEDEPTLKALSLTSETNAGYMGDMIGVAGGSGQEAAARQMQLFSDFNTRINRADFIHYRFNTRYDKTKNTELDNSGPEFNAYMEQACDAQFQKDLFKIMAFINNCDF